MTRPAGSPSEVRGGSPIAQPLGAADGVTDAVEAVDDDSAVDCETCGCCCAFSWEWPTFVGDRDGEGIPEYLTEDGRMRCDGDRCAALFGTVGVEVHCRVYPDRPLVCREFAAGSPACRAVRRHFGLGQGTAR